MKKYWTALLRKQVVRLPVLEAEKQIMVLGAEKQTMILEAENSTRYRKGWSLLRALRKGSVPVRYFLGL